MAGPSHITYKESNRTSHMFELLRITVPYTVRRSSVKVHLGSMILHTCEHFNMFEVLFLLQLTNISIHILRIVLHP